MKTAIAAAAFVASASAAFNASSFPSCWSTCFSENHLEDEACLCDDSTGAAITKCISSGCDSADSSAYDSWLKSYCAAPTSTSTSSTAAWPTYPSGTGPAGSWPTPSSPKAPYPTTSDPSWPEGSWPTPSPSTSTIYTTTCPYDPTRSPGEVWTTTITESITVIPHEKSYSWGQWTSKYTSYESQTNTGEWTVTNTGAPSYPTTAPPATSTVPFTTFKPKSCTSGTPLPAPSSCVPCQGQGSGPWCGLTLDDDWYEVAPNTCNVVEYNWNLTQGLVSPDGVERMAFLINNQFPGPMIKANWGDTVVVKLTNLLPNSIDNGTSLHFHGVRQNGTNEYDGVSSITQCPLAPGDTMTYTWRATSYGSSWWHSHFSLQTYEGMFGPLVIEGPSTLSYDEEQFVILQDWNHATADSLFDDSQVVVPGVRGGGLTLDTGLINGKNVWGNGGEYWSMTVTPGKSYRLRVLNAAIQSTFKFHIDGHSFQVIAMDFVPIHPYTTDIVSVNIGQRYDLILTANQAPANYWIRSDNQQPCGQLEQPNVQAILNYEGVKFATPTTTGLNYQPDCLDEPSASLVPYLAQNAGAQSAGEFVETSIIAANGAVPNLYKWTLSGSTFQANWNDPTLFSIWYDGDVPQYGGDLTVELPNAGEWVYFVIDSPMPLPHPIHLHGHDFFLLASGVGTYSADVPLQLTNPPRRDVAVMPADPLTGSGGYLVVAYQVSNPGVWLMHCHIGWHNTMGFALQIVEMIDSIKIENTCQLQETCVNWLNYANANSIFDAPFDDGV